MSMDISVLNDVFVSMEVSDCSVTGRYGNTPTNISGEMNETPGIVEAHTSNHSFEDSDESSSEPSLVDSNSNDSQTSENEDSANSILKNLRIKNINRLIIGTLNKNFTAPKFDQLKEVIGNYLDIFTVQETKLDKSFTDDQFEIEGYHKPYRLDRNKHGAEV